MVEQLPVVCETPGLMPKTRKAAPAMNLDSESVALVWKHFGIVGESCIAGSGTRYYIEGCSILLKTKKKEDKESITKL